MRSGARRSKPPEKSIRTRVGVKSLYKDLLEETDGGGFWEPYLKTAKDTVGQLAGRFLNPN